MNKKEDIKLLYKHKLQKIIDESLITKINQFEKKSFLNRDSPVHTFDAISIEKNEEITNNMVYDILHLMYEEKGFYMSDRFHNQVRIRKVQGSEEFEVMLIEKENEYMLLINDSPMKKSYLP